MLTCSVVLWGGRNTANKYPWCVWGVLPVSRPHWVCPCSRRVCFPSVCYSVQALGCSAGNCLRWGLVCMHFPGLSLSGSGSWVLHKGADLVGPPFCAFPRSKQLRWPGAWWVHLPPVGGCDLIASPVPAARFSGCTAGAPSQVCCVSFLESWSLAMTLPADVNRPESQKVLVSSEACLQFGRWCLSGAVIACFQLWLPSPACLWWGMGWSAAS